MSIKSLPPERFFISCLSSISTIKFWIQYYPADVEEVKPVEKKSNNGETCKKCKEYFPFAESNQDDSTFICWGCKNGY